MQVSSKGINIWRKTMEAGQVGCGGNKAREVKQELPRKPLGAKQRSSVFILKSMGNIEGF